VRAAALFALVACTHAAGSGTYRMALEYREFVVLLDESAPGPGPGVAWCAQHYAHRGCYLPATALGPAVVPVYWMQLNDGRIEVSLTCGADVTRTLRFAPGATTGELTYKGAPAQPVQLDRLRGPDAELCK
jgi:hypothetical protein